MKFNRKTRELIRNVMADRKVSRAELEKLAIFLNQDREARNSWPGNAIFMVLHDILADGEIDPPELRGLTEILAGIEILCDGHDQRATQAMEPPQSGSRVPIGRQRYSAEGPLNLPAVEGLDEVASKLDPAIDLGSFSCECDDWDGKRVKFAAGSPGRVCRCIVKLLDEMLDTGDGLHLWPSILQDIVRLQAASGRGFEAIERWESLALDGRQAAIAIGTTDWCPLYVAGAGTLEKFTYNHALRRWAHGNRPYGSADIESLVSEEVVGGGEPPAGEPRAMHILVAEDEADDREMLERALKKIGRRTQLHFVGDGKEVIEFLTGTGAYVRGARPPKPDLILLDLNMPKMTGIEVLQMLPDLEDAAQIPVVVLTGSTSDEDLLKSFELGAHSYQEKPVGLANWNKLARQLESFWVVS